MKRKTISIDLDVYREIRRRQFPYESLSATLRGTFEREKDPAEYLEGLFRDFAETGVTSDEGLERLRSRQQRPLRSRRPARPTRKDAA